MQKETKVLDHGYVRYQGHLGGEEDIIRAARMSTDKGFLGWSEPYNPNELVSCIAGAHYLSVKCALHSKGAGAPNDEKLLEYLYKNHHMTPFEMLELRVEVKAPIFVFREWHRHRTFSYNEMSARYIQMPNEHYVPELRFQDTKNKQGSTTDHHTGQGCWELDNFKQIIKDEQDRIYDHYENCWIANGVAKEVARINTPVSRYSKMWAKANLRNWLHFLNLRLRPNAQLEIRLYAEAVRDIIKELWPRTYDLFENYTLESVSFSRDEWKTRSASEDTK